MAELVDAHVSGACECKFVWVRVPLSALFPLQPTFYDPIKPTFGNQSSQEEQQRSTAAYRIAKPKTSIRFKDSIYNLLF